MPEDSPFLWVYVGRGADAAPPEGPWPPVLSGSCWVGGGVQRLSLKHCALQRGRSALSPGSFSQIICQPIGYAFVYLQIIMCYSLCSACEESLNLDTKIILC